jgi:hypothetical protein
MSVECDLNKCKVINLDTNLESITCLDDGQSTTSKSRLLVLKEATSRLILVKSNECTEQGKFALGTEVLLF